MQREGLGMCDGSESYFETKHNCAEKFTLVSLARARAGFGRGVSDSGRPPVGGRFHHWQPDRTPFSRLTPPGLRPPFIRKNRHAPTGVDGTRRPAYVYGGRPGGAGAKCCESATARSALNKGKSACASARILRSAASGHRDNLNKVMHHILFGNILQLL